MNFNCPSCDTRLAVADGVATCPNCSANVETSPGSPDVWEMALAGSEAAAMFARLEETRLYRQSTGRMRAAL